MAEDVCYGTPHIRCCDRLGLKMLVYALGGPRLGVVVAVYGY